MCLSPRFNTKPPFLVRRFELLALLQLRYTSGFQLSTVKEEIFVGEKFRTFPSKTLRMELNFVLSNWPKTEKTRKDDRKACKPCGRNFGMEINFVHFWRIRKLRNLIPYENFFFYSNWRRASGSICLTKNEGFVLQWGGGGGLGRDTFFKLFVLCFLPKLTVLSQVTSIYKVMNGLKKLCMHYHWTYCHFQIYYSACQSRLDLWGSDEV